MCLCYVAAAVAGNVRDYVITRRLGSITVTLSAISAGSYSYIKLVDMSVRSSGHVTEVSPGCTPDVDVTTNCVTSGGSNTAVSHINSISDQPWRRLTESSTADVTLQSSLPLTTSCGDRRPSFMIDDILGGQQCSSPVELLTRPTPLVSATAAHLASMSAHLDFSAMAHHRPFPSSSAAAAAAAAAVCLQRRGLDDGVDINRCLQSLPPGEFRRLPVLHDVSGVWTSPVNVVSQLNKRASSYSAECGSDVDVDLDDDNDVDSTSSFAGQFILHVHRFCA